jgi:hypothetical protein
MSHKPALPLAIALGVAGLFSALLFICELSNYGELSDLLPGALFGAAVGLCLWLYGLVRTLWKLLIITGISSVTLFFSALIDVYLEYFSPWPLHAIGTPFSNASHAALFAGGVSGLFLLVAAFFLILDAGQPVRKTIFKALCWSPIGGALAVVGWTLGPWLGGALWSLQHDLGLTSPSDRLAYALLQGRTSIDSLLAVWQTGVGLILGIALTVGTSVKEARHLEGASPD